jgi:molybdopterin/thiamine biosynthesis adenylyltransferase
MLIINELERYDRQIIIKGLGEEGEEGQERPKL